MIFLFILWNLQQKKVHIFHTVLIDRLIDDTATFCLEISATIIIKLVRLASRQFTYMVVHSYVIFEVSYSI